MGKNVLILSGSPRKGGNSDLLCDEFMRGAQEKGNNVEKIRIVAKKYNHAPPATIAATIRAHVYTRMIWQKFYKR